MSPQAFTFKLTVPNDPAGASVVAVVAAHAAEYAQLDAATCSAFAEKARAAAVQALKQGGSQGTLATVGAADGQLTLTIGGQTVSHPISA